MTPTLGFISTPKVAVKGDFLQPGMQGGRLLSPAFEPPADSGLVSEASFLQQASVHP